MASAMSSQNRTSDNASQQSKSRVDTVPNRSKLTSHMVSSFQIAKVHRNHEKPVSCLDFSHDGNLLASCAPDHTVQVFDCLTGHKKGDIPVRKYGAGVVRFIQGKSPPTVVTASTSGSNTIRALDLEKRCYFRNFEGHNAEVASISSSPAGPEFLSTSRDSYVMLWDCRMEVARGSVQASGTPIVAYDPKGLIFGIAYNMSNQKSVVKLYDARQYNEGPFLEFPIENSSDAPPSCLKFSSDGEYFILVNPDVSATVSVYDAYKGALYRTFTGHRNTRGIALEASFSPDSAFLSTGSEDGAIYMWDLKTKRLLLDKPGTHALPSACASWNPVYALFASACQNVVMWLPQEETDQEY